LVAIIALAPGPLAGELEPKSQKKTGRMIDLTDGLTCER
jgi:acetyl-CoA carboxylase carboxyltransferase component